MPGLYIYNNHKIDNNIIHHTQAVKKYMEDETHTCHVRLDYPKIKILKNENNEKIVKSIEELSSSTYYRFHKHVRFHPCASYNKQ